MRSKYIRRIFLLLSVVACGMMATSCDKSDDENTVAIKNLPYEGEWVFPFIEDGMFIKEGVLRILPSGEMTWIMPGQGEYKAQLHVTGNDEAKITYNGKTYTAEMHFVNESNAQLKINVNGSEDLLVKDFPFDGVYIYMKRR